MSVKNLYYEKYLKYKNKYLNLQSQMGGIHLIDRQNSTFITDQGNEPTCWAHATTRVIMKLITTFFYNYFSGINECHYYYNTVECSNDKINIFDCFLQIKKGNRNCKS